jgi:hypothetical protein
MNEKMLQELEDLFVKATCGGPEDKEMLWKAMPFAYYHPRDATPDNPGGWTDGGDDDWFVYCVHPTDKAKGGNITGNGQDKNDALFIAAAREAIPKLIAEIRRLRSAHYNIFGALNKPVIYDPSADDKYSDLEIGELYSGVL